MNSEDQKVLSKKLLQAVTSEYHKEVGFNTFS